MIKIFFFLIFFIFKYEIFANELSFTYDVKGTLVKEEIVNFPSGKKFLSFRHEGGFETSIARYGFYYCTGSMLYNKNGNLEDMTYACEFQDQNNDKFFSMGKDSVKIQVPSNVVSDWQHPLKNSTSMVILNYVCKNKGIIL